MTSRFTFFARLLSALAIVAAPLLAQAQSWPTKPIHIVFPYPPGSPVDAVGRMISDRAARILGQPLVFENRPGANGILGTTYVARVPADGYTIHLTTTSAFLLNSFLRKDLPYDPVKHFTPIAAVADIPVALMVRSDMPVRDTPEFIAHLKREPGKVSYGSVGNGSFSHLLMEQFKTAAGVDMLHVPFQGSAQIVVEMIANRIDATVLAEASVAGQWKTGQIRALAFMTPRRNPTHPEIPTLTEQYPGFHPFGNWMGF